MFSLHTLTLKNFRSYKGAHSFEFPAETGLYFLRGENHVEPSLGPNGAGKSTLLDAIVWALYGRTARGLRSNEVPSWGQSGCMVTLELTVAGKRLKIKRGQRPMILTLNDKPVDQDELQKSIRLNYDAFMSSVLSSQFGQSFLSLLPSAKLTLFSVILTLDLWLKKSEEAAKLSAVCAQNLEAVKAAAALYKGTADNLKFDISQLINDEALFAERQQVKIDAAKEQQDLVEDEIERLRAVIVSLKKDRDKAKANLNNLNKQIAFLAPRKNKIADKVAQLNAERLKHSNDMKLIESQLDKLSELTTDCPTCLQVVRTTYLNSEKVRLENKLDVARNAFKELSEKVMPLDNELNRKQTEVDEQTLITEQIWDEISQIETKLGREPVKMQAARERADEIVFRLREVSSQKSPYAGMLADKRKDLQKLKVKLADSLISVDALETELAATSYWIKGFKQIRLLIIEQAFRTLEIEVNNSLAQLGMPNWQITFDIERENKSGGITKGFIAFIKGPANTEPVRWENWSGGETQRLQLAADLGLSNLIMTQNGLTNTIEIFDEPSTHLSTEGTLDLATMLHERALSEEKRIWIVDHSSITNFGEFQGVITARKTSHGSTIDYQAS